MLQHLTLLVSFSQPEDGQSTCMETANLQPLVQHQAVHNGPGEALSADVGAPQQRQQARPHGQTPNSRNQRECLNWKHAPPRNPNRFIHYQVSLELPVLYQLVLAFNGTPPSMEPAHGHIWTSVADVIKSHIRICWARLSLEHSGT